MRRVRRPRLRAFVDLPVSIGPGTQVTGRVFTFDDLADGQEHLVVALGSYGQPVGGVPLVRLHSECLTGDVFGSRRCDCGPQLEESMERIAAVGGYLVYLRQEGRGIGLYAKLDAYRLQDGGMDTFEANRALGYADDARDYRVAAGMLQALGVARLDLLTGNRQKVADLVDSGVVVRAVLPTGLHQTAENLRYLDAKVARGFTFAARTEPMAGPALAAARASSP